MSFQFLISGFDTIECAYYLIGTDDYKLDFIELINHSKLFGRGKNHINGIENFWNQAKRVLRKFG